MSSVQRSVGVGGGFEPHETLRRLTAGNCRLGKSTKPVRAPGVQEPHRPNVSLLESALNQGMVDISTIATVTTTLAVLVGLAIAILQLRDLKKGEGG